MDKQGDKSGITSAEESDPKKRHAYMFHNGWLAMGSAGLQVIEHMDSLVVARVWATILRHMENGNRVIVNQSALAKYLGITQPTASRAIQRLVDDELIVREEKKAGAMKVYRVKPHLAFRGSAKAQNEAVKIAAMKQAKTTRQRMRSARIKAVVQGGKE